MDSVKAEDVIGDKAVFAKANMRLDCLAFYLT